jgi:exodeoxyribonuclease VII small subunit
MATKKETTDFKSAIKELEQISQWFQSEDIDLDEGLTKLKRAKELIAITKDKLSEVENEFNTLKKESISSTPIEAIEEIFQNQKESTTGLQFDD